MGKLILVSLFFGYMSMLCQGQVVAYTQENDNFVYEEVAVEEKKEEQKAVTKQTKIKTVFTKKVYTEIINNQFKKIITYINLNGDSLS